MIVMCRACGTRYDDGAQWTLCPHAKRQAPPLTDEQHEVEHRLTQYDLAVGPMGFNGRGR